MTTSAHGAGSAAGAPNLREIAHAARTAGRLAFDTEFMGEGRYRTLLCLIQLAVPDGASGERIELLDPLDPHFDGAPLAAVLADPAVQIVVHAGRQDIALVRRLLATEVTNVFDTQLAAGFAGMPAQASYDTLLSGLLHVRVAKSASFTRWDSRPLSAEQLAYAREDVVHLLSLALELERRLSASGRLDWALEECEPLALSSDERDLDTIFARLPRIRSLSASAQTIARELVAWRERLAASQDRPVQSILSDAALVEVAKRRPDSIGRLEHIRGVHPTGLRRRGRDLLDAVARGSSLPPQPLPAEARPPAPDPDDAPLIALSEALVRARAREAGLAYELLASRADLQTIVTRHRRGHQRDHQRGQRGQRGPSSDRPGEAQVRPGEAQVRTLHGWRRELVGRELLELLDGRLSLSIENSRLRVGS